MSDVPIDILNITAAAGVTNKLVTGNIKGALGASATISANACHGIELGIGANAQALVDADARLAFIGSRARGQAEATAGAKVAVRMEPNPFDKMGLMVEGGAYAYAAAAGNLGIYFDPSFFVPFIEEELDEFTGDLFLIFLDEVKAEVGVWGKVAISAAAEGHLNIILDLQNLNGGFEINLGGNIGLEAGAGYDVYAQVGFENLRRAVRRSTMRINRELLKYVRQSDLPQRELLAAALDFSFPLLALIAYDLGQKSYEKKALTTKEDIAKIVFENFVQNLQRYTLDKVSESAIAWLEKEFIIIYTRISTVTLTSTQKSSVRSHIELIITKLRRGDFKQDDIAQIVTAIIEIVDMLDADVLDELKRPLAIFWTSSMLGLVVKDMLASFYAEADISSSAIGQAGFAAASSLLPTAPNFVKTAIAEELDEQTAEIDVSVAIDFLVEVGCNDILDRYVPEYGIFRSQIATYFPISEGELVEDLLRLLAGQGQMTDLNSYTAFKAFFQAKILEGFVINELLPQLKETVDSDMLAEYIKEVLEPSAWLVNDFVFSKLDTILINNLHGMSEDRRAQFMDSLSTGSGIVVYQILSRNILYFDQVFTDFVLDNGYQGFRNIRTQLEQPEHPLFQTCRHLFETHLPGNPNLSQQTEAFQILLYDITAASEEAFGPTVYTPERRRALTRLKRNILLSIGGSWDRSNTLMPEAAIEEAIDCLHIPALDAVEELASLIAEISFESALIFAQRIALPIADFYLRLTAIEFENLRYGLNQFINGLSITAQNALAILDQLTDDLQTDILDRLEDLEQILGDLQLLIQNQIDAYSTLAKTAIRLTAESAAISQGVANGQTENQARADFYTNQWPVAEVIVDTALAVTQPFVDALFTEMNDAIESGENATQVLFSGIESIEASLITGLTTLVILPAEDAVAAVIDAVFSDLFLNAIDEYLAGREEKKQLELERHDAEANLILATEDARLARQKLSQNAHQQALRVEIVNPLADLSYIYPASVEIIFVVYNATASMMTQPQSSRIQIKLNSKPLFYRPGDWQYNSDSNSYELRKIFEPGELIHGLNTLEASWIIGPIAAETERTAMSFMVDADQYYPKADFEIFIDVNPPGRDVDHEYVQITWNGDAPIDLHQWLIRDKVGHTYAFSDIILRPGDNVKLFTGGLIENDQKNLDRKNKVLHMGRGRAVWNNDGDTMMLSNPEKTVVVTYSY